MIVGAETTIGKSRTVGVREERASRLRGADAA